MKKLIAAVTTAGLLIVGTAGVAAAADSPTTKAPAGAAQGHPALRRHRVKAALKLAATTIGIEPKALAQELKDGKSVADVAKSHNVDPQKVIDAIVAAANKKVDEAVSAGKIDADTAATIKERLPDRVAKLVNGTLKGKHPVERAKLRRNARRGGVEVAAKHDRHRAQGAGRRGEGRADRRRRGEEPQHRPAEGHRRGRRGGGQADRRRGRPPARSTPIAPRS